MRSFGNYAKNYLELDLKIGYKVFPLLYWIDIIEAVV